MDYRLPEKSHSMERWAQRPDRHFFTLLQEFLVASLPLLPPTLTLTTIRQVLDVACGSGTWIRALVRTYPRLEVMGIEREQQIIEYARSLSWYTRLSHSSFLAAELSDLPITPQFFDLVHARFLPPSSTGEMQRRQIQALARVCAPEGYVVWTEWTLPTSNGEACTALSHRVKQASTPHFYRCDAPYEMETLLSNALALPIAALQVQETSIMYPLKNGNEHLATSLSELIAALFDFLRFFLLTRRVARAREIDALLHQCRTETHDPTFYATWTLKTVIGQKPLHF